MTAAYAVVGQLPPRMPPGSKYPWSKYSFTSKGARSQKTCREDIFFSALSSLKAKGDAASFSFGGSLGFPRIATAGAKPTIFAPLTREKLRVNNRMTMGDNPNKRKLENCFWEDTEKYLENEDSDSKKQKTTNSDDDALVWSVGDQENSSGRQGDVSHHGILDLTAAANLFERLTIKEDFGKVKGTLPLTLHNHLKQLSKAKPSIEVGLEIAGSVYLLMLLGSSTSCFNSAAKKAGRGAMMLQEGMRLLIEGQEDLSQSSTFDA